MTLWSRTRILVLAIVAGVALPAAAALGADDKCTIAVQGDSPVAKACAEGGRPAAKKVMKDAVQKAKANGQKFTCDGCHENLDTYKLTKDARQMLPKLLAAAAAKK